jgi:hypothetical protein
MPGKERVLKFNRTDDNTKYILVNVKDRGPRSLDLKIEATEFDAEYALRRECTIYRAGYFMLTDCDIQ